MTAAGARTPLGDGRAVGGTRPGVAGGGFRWLATALSALSVLGLGLLAGCGNGDTTDTTARDAAIYRSVILDLVDRSGGDLHAAEDLPVVFIEALGPEGIPLGVQVEVVGGFVEQYEIRFIDDFHEAVEAELPGLPVREGSLLIGLGDIDLDDAGLGTADVHSEVYLASDEITGLGYVLADGGDLGWNIVGSPIDAEAEGLKPAS